MQKSNTQTAMLIFESELAAIERETLAWPNLETGGDLYGYFTYAGWPVVQLVVNANADARRQSVTFHPDAHQTETEGRRLIDTYGLQHLGHWHSHHHLSLTRPSGVDRSTVVSAMTKYHLSSFLQVIANIRESDGEPRAIANAFNYTTGSGENCIDIPWLVLPGVSPARFAVTGSKNFAATTIELFPHTITWEDLRGGTHTTAAAPAELDVNLLHRLGEELGRLHAAGLEGRGKRRGNELRIDINHAGRRFAVVLPPGFPETAPQIRRLFDDAPEVVIEMEWSPTQHIAELILAAAPLPQADAGPKKQTASVKKTKRGRVSRTLRRATATIRRAARKAAGKTRNGGQSCSAG